MDKMQKIFDDLKLKKLQSTDQIFAYAIRNSFARLNQVEKLFSQQF